MSTTGHDSLNVRRTFSAGGKDFDYYSLEAAEAAGLGDIKSLPISMKVILENLLRREDGRMVTVDDVIALINWRETCHSDHEIAYRPARVLLQDFTGVPAIVDLASMRDAMVDIGDDPERINPLSPVDLVIDHSLMAEYAGTHGAIEKNVRMEFERNQERYEFLKWGQGAFQNMRVVPPGTGICHQVNLEYLAQVVFSEKVDGKEVAYPDTLVGTDSHTTMVNGLSVLGWGVGGIEAEAVMLGQPISMLVPEVIGFKLAGAMTEGTTATDLVLTVVEILRHKGVVGKFVEFYGPGLDNLTLADQATIANMAPEYGATCGFFPITQATLDYMAFTGRDAHQVALVEAYAKVQGMWRGRDTPDPVFSDILELDLGDVAASIAGPKRPQDRISLKDASITFKAQFKEIAGRAEHRTCAVDGFDYRLEDGAVMIAAITSCTNTSNPSVMVAAGLVAKNAHEMGLSVKPWVKTSLAPGSKVVSDYLEAGGLQEHLDAMGYQVIGYGCTTCIGSSGLTHEKLVDSIKEQDLTVTAVLSGNRNFEGRISPWTKANYLASPPLVVAYALAGNMNIDLLNDVIGKDWDGNPVYLRDIWPTNKDVQEYIQSVLTPEMFRKRYANIIDGDPNWQKIKTVPSLTYNWSAGSTYIKKPPFFENVSPDGREAADILDARPLALLGDFITTDHISPAGSIMRESPAGELLTQHQIRPQDFNSYGSRRGNHEVMMRGTFANIRIKNEMLPGAEGNWTIHRPSGERISMYEAAMRYKKEGVPLFVFGGKEYGTGSSRDWAAKGIQLLGVKAVIAESFERIHRSNLVGMGVLPLQFKKGITRSTLGLDGTETFDLMGLANGISPFMDVTLKINRIDGSFEDADLICRIDTLDEVDYYSAGGILQYVLLNLSEVASSQHPSYRDKAKTSQKRL